MMMRLHLGTDLLLTSSQRIGVGPCLFGPSIPPGSCRRPVRVTAAATCSAHPLYSDLTWEQSQPPATHTRIYHSLLYTFPPLFFIHLLIRTYPKYLSISTMHLPEFISSFTSSDPLLASLALARVS